MLNMLNARYYRALGVILLLSLDSVSPAAGQAVRQGDDGRLHYAVDEQGNRIVDFSHCGYAGGDRAVPDVPGRLIVAPADGDDGAQIQAAIDEVARLPLDASGVRGAVVLAPGRFEVQGQLRVAAAGIVLRGSGALGDGAGGTTIVATGQDRRALIHVGGAGRQRTVGESIRIDQEYVPVGASRFRVEKPNALRAGDPVLITRPSTAEWIAAIGADAFGVGWRPGSRDIRWERTIVKVEGDLIEIDVPLTTALEQQYGGGTVQKVEYPDRVTNVGVEDIRLKSAFAEDKPHDEEHAWFGIVANHVRGFWIRRVEFRHFAGGAVSLLEGASRGSVEDCISLAPVSEVGGYRRHTFFTQGQQTLFLRCWSELGRHDFSVGHVAPGPNAFVNCYADRALADSGPLESWASGVLYDNVRIDGNELRLVNRWSSPSGAGWTAANCVLWQCQAAVIRCFRPPTANNWAIGTWAEYAGDGTFEARSDFVKPLSLYQAQLENRLGAEAGKRAGPFLLDPIGSTNPTPEEAAAFSASSKKPAPRLIELIRERMAARARPPDERGGPFAGKVSEPQQAEQGGAIYRLDLANGWLQIDGRVATGKWLTPSWWRGVIRPEEASAFGPSITKFAPGRVGVGLTDDLHELASRMQSDGTAVYEHHYGLWYDRRRDDHLMVRRADGNVAPPFFEQPFARTGRGRAWDGLSKYDLTEWNPWYWRRLHDFARLCDERGLTFIHQNYFQHNILEAGAHWADSPWRPVNNVNDAGFPEPPPYVGDKRIFLAEQFYDVSHPRRRELHRNYIRKCLDNFADCHNVIQATSAEFSGPLEFVQFWIDTIAEWEKEHGQDVLVALSAPKDVQDAILADEARARRVDVIDIRYWCYTAGGELYAPGGGQQMAPRQHLRRTRQKPGGAEAIVRAVREYRDRFPEKAVVYRAEQYCPSDDDEWAKLAGGASLAETPPLPRELAVALVGMKPTDDVAGGEGVFCLGGDGHYLVYAPHESANVELTLPRAGRTYTSSWIDAEEGTLSAGPSLHGGTSERVAFQQRVLWIREESP
jgi:hypothetical protein